MNAVAGAKRILFVDDEQSILDGLSNLLRRQRKRWQMTFALGAEAALAELAKARYDVVVSDMRMPGMDGAALLAAVKQKYPDTARIILSGHPERSSILAALSVAHQFLNKPCNGEILTGVIERTCQLQALLGNESVRTVVGKLDKLPSPPKVYLELVSCASDPRAGVADLARIVEQDPAMSIKVLQLVNSAFFGLAQRVASVGKAAGYLGSELLKGLALNAHVFAELKATGRTKALLERVHEQSLIAGRLASLFLEEKQAAEQAMTAALVHDAGFLILSQAMPAELEELLRAAEESGSSFPVQEERSLGVTHSEVGAYLLGVWGLPFPTVEAVAYHHRPSLVGAGAREVLAAVHCTTALLDGGEADLAFLEQAGLASRLPGWRTRAEQELEALRRRKAG